ncbi:MAG: hypothetical protein K0S63_46, partial [Gammaproteobacteria bacterium]|nr:hypothetical protein [Gammaproteobacteria bacterium]
MQRINVQMLNARKSIADWEPPLGGILEIEIQTDLYSEEEFSGFLNKLCRHYSNLPVRQRPHLSFKGYSPTSYGFLELLKCAKTWKEKLPFSELTLHIDPLSIVKGYYRDNYQNIFELMEALNGTSLRQLHLIIRDPSVMKLFLESQCVQSIHYPMTMDMSWQDEEKKLEELYSNFWKSLILRIQEHNQKVAPAYLKKRSPDSMEEKKEEEEENVVNDLAAPKIKLKELITQHLRSEAHDSVYDDLIDVEEQHVEQEEIEAIEQEEVVAEEIVAAEQVEEEQQQQEEQYAFGLPLIGSKEFKEKYLYIDPWGNKKSEINSNHLNDIENELFNGGSDWRDAIAWLSPEAAAVMAKHLSVFISLDLDNLPPYFLIKERMYARFRATRASSVRGDSVLDYDPRVESRKTNAYTPKEALKCDHRQRSVYPIQIIDQLGEDLRNNPTYTTFIEENKSHFVNMWIYHGERGVQAFCNHLGFFDSDDDRRSMKKCLLDNYLKHFPHWDHFLEDNSFFECLERIHDYSLPQRACLQQFLSTTGPSHHDLADTLTGFEEFWKEWTQLCKEHNILDLGCLSNVKWYTRYGHPVVYMERLITILKNARNLEEQIECLEGITLNSYGVYCDSKYRNFKIVSYEMQNSRNIMIWRSARIQRHRDNNAERDITDCYREIGQELKSIPIKTLVKKYEDYEQVHQERDLGGLGFSSAPGVLQTALFFIRHERYAGEEDIIPELFKAVGKYKLKKSKLSNLNLSIDTHLRQLLAQGCLLSPAEGILVCYEIAKELENQYHSYEMSLSAMEKLCKKVADLFNSLQDPSSRVQKLRALNRTSSIGLSQQAKICLNQKLSEETLASQAQQQVERFEESWNVLRAQSYFKRHQGKMDSLLSENHFHSFPLPIRFQL